MTVGIVDDHLMFRDLVRGICHEVAGLHVVFEAGTGVEAVGNILTAKPELLVLDIGLPDIDGCEVLDRIHFYGMSPRVLVLSGYCSPYLVFRLGRLGIQAFLDKATGTISSLRATFSDFLNYRQVYSASFLATQEKRKRDALAFDKLLTNQQILVLSLVAHNLNDPAISEYLEIGVRTVENHRTEIMRKLNIHSRVDLMRFAAEQGFDVGPIPSRETIRLRGHR